ncbi:MAG TPA: hypothetical protein VKD67_08405 [Acidimicrobiales bacterium]|nr:hypothetical protein [Acidimicrobiales bacterium]
MTGTVIGTLGSSWRATVTEDGAVVPWEGEAPLDWWVAADDRWHVPADEPSRRQSRLRGTPVVETVVAVPGGEVAHRAYAVPLGTRARAVVEVENRSALPVAVAVSRRDVVTGRPLAPTAPGAPVGAAVAVPVGHRSTVRLVVGNGLSPAAVPSADAVARGWVAQTETAARYAVPDERLVRRVVEARSDALLTVPGAEDPVGRLLAVAERVRLGEPAAPWVDDVAAGAVAVVRAADRSGAAWDDLAALAAAADVLRRAGEHRGAGDVDAMRVRCGAAAVPATPPDGIRVVAWLAGRLLHATRTGADLVPGFDPAWAGQGLEVYEAPAGRAVIGFAVRWHGERPALLWEASAPMHLTCSGLDPSWSTDQTRGEALLAPFSP